jgi:glyoxylase-like metal-dependent hydrolase (beta-lactamase superfamily II)
MRSVPLVVDTLELGPIGTNCHLVRADRGSPVAVVVDPSGPAAEIRLRLASAGARCAAILVTHCHWDHFLGLAELAEGTGAPVWLPRDEEPVFRQPGDVYRGLGVTVPAYEGEATLVAGGEEVEAAGITFDVVAVPGHSPGHVAYQADGHLFSGDVLFAGGVGRVDLPGGDWPTLMASIETLLDRYPADTVVHSGHGPDTTLGEELTRNPFLADLRAERQAAGD